MVTHNPVKAFYLEKNTSENLYKIGHSIEKREETGKEGYEEKWSNIQEVSSGKDAVGFEGRVNNFPSGVAHASLTSHFCFIFKDDL